MLNTVKNQSKFKSDDPRRVRLQKSIRIRSLWFWRKTSLVPEKSKKFGIGFQQSKRATELDMRFFDNEIDDLVAFSYVDWKLYNIEEAETRGVLI
ncbi:MAG: hypothetical protein Ct9H90mP13_05230 [Pseudomonadota bacterium]|nr:MAG: hypothetical protein Ct9H90mP13_05230 [Pseudomonadota bacterium]